MFRLYGKKDSERTSSQLSTVERKVETSPQSLRSPRVLRGLVFGGLVPRPLPTPGGRHKIWFSFGLRYHKTPSGTVPVNSGDRK